MSLIVTSPVSGTVVGLEGIDDPVFAAAMVGPGTAVDPDRQPGQVCAPLAGTLRKLKPHAFIIVAPDGRGVLVHLGIDTVGLGGFELLAREGDSVSAGAPVVGWDPRFVAAAGHSPVCAVVALDANADELASRGSGPVEIGDPLFSWS
jgi:sugar PTS system EIIA component